MMRAHLPWSLRPLAAALCLAASPAAWALGDADPTRLSLEELMKIEVSSAARKPQPLSDTATALHVINRDDIRRSGASSLPELLRTVPGVQVSRIDGSRYAITIRGFASRYAGKLLVLLDGRTLYSPMFNGTFWESQDLVLDDIERIEVIRGPGGTMWGANAFNGVINIISRAAKDTQGTLVQVQGGSEESGLALRHGGVLGEAGHFRAYAKVGQRDALSREGASLPAHDGARQRRAGFRVDLQPAAADRLTLQGDVHDVHADVNELATALDSPGVTLAPDTQHQMGANLLLRWEREVNPGNHLQLQAYADRVDGRSDAFSLSVDTLDLEFQQRLQVTPAQELTWGAGLRQVHDRTRGSLTLTMDPATARRDTYSAFLQDEISLDPAWSLTLGSKFEYNDTTGGETQPSARLHWQAMPGHAFWAAISRAVETPSRATMNSQINYAVIPAFTPLNPSPWPAVLGLSGSPGVVSQELVARELGYRGLFGHDLSVDLTVFHHEYDHLVSIGGFSATPGYVYNGVAYVQAGYDFTNDLRGHAYGVELASTWQVSPAWRLSGSLSTLRMKLKAYPGGTGESAFGSTGASPGFMTQLHSQLDLGHNVELDAHLYRNGPLAELNVPAHTRLDLRLGWRVRPGLELSLTGRNLLQRSHREFEAEDVQASDIPRSWLLQGHWKF
jgi:iron complex outermembrane receptor protein